MAKERHKQDTEFFEGLTFAEQSKSLNIQIVNLAKAINAHKRKGTSENRNSEKITLIYTKQLVKLIGKINT